MAWQWDGTAFQPAESVPLTDRGFRYGMSLFESLRVVRGEAQFFEEHLARLVGGCAERGFAVEAEALCASATLFEKREAFARIYVTAGDGSPTAGAPAPRIFVLLEERAQPGPDETWEITLCEDSYRAPFGGAKTGNYWFNVEALAEARRRGFDEALLFNERAELVSACMANVFLVHEERLSTPARASGCRAGVIREWVMKRRRVAERRVRREDVLSANEIFLTNSWIGVLPVATLEGRPLGPRAIGPKLAAELAARSEEIKEGRASRRPAG